MIEKTPSESTDSASRTVALQRQLSAWAREIGCEDFKVAGDLAELHAAALAIGERIERLAASEHLGRAETRKILVELQAWLYDEFKDHMESVRVPLSRAVDSLY
jgi:hypothetical protein